MIVGMTGLAGSGKDTFARQLIRRHGFVKHSFAKKLKALCSALYGWNIDELERLDYKEAPSLHDDRTIETTDVEKVYDNWHLERFAAPREGISYLYAILNVVRPEWTRRRILQWVGTEGFRKIHPDVWVILALDKIEADAATRVVFTDVRFDNEAAAIRERGGVVIQMVREGWSPGEATVAHASEKGVSSELIDRVVASPNNRLDLVYAAADAWISEVGLDK